MINSLKERKSKRLIAIDSKSSAGTIESTITASKNLKSYFKCFNFYASYDEQIVDNKSISNIPVLSILLPLAWITGADICIDELDKTFAESAEALQQEFKKIYPKAPFKTNLHTEKLIENEPGPDNPALLFSAGLDSFYSLITNISLNPRLLMVFGSDIPVENVTFQEETRSEYSNLAKKLGVSMNFISTNALKLFNRRRVDHLFWRFRGLHEGDLWKGVGYSLGHIGLIAPLSIGRFNHVIVPAGGVSKEIAYGVKKYPDASSPVTDEIISWANMKVQHDACVPRAEKAFALEKLMEKHKVNLRVCLFQPKKMTVKGKPNCSRCEKCLRTIAALILAGINPNYCGFIVDDSMFDLMKELFEQKKLSQFSIKIWWKPLQKMVPDKIDGDFYGSKKFLEWFKPLNLDLMTSPFFSRRSALYYNLPFPVAVTLSKVFHSVRRKQDPKSKGIMLIFKNMLSGQ